VDTLNRTKDDYVHYEFVCVKCNDCGVESNPFTFKEHLTADESFIYIEQISGFKLRENNTGMRGFVAGSGDYGEGGLICSACQGNILEEVANG